MTKPFIGVNADYRPSKQDLPAFTYVASGYYDAILAVGGIPLILPPYESERTSKTPSTAWTACCWSAGPTSIHAATAGCSTRRSGCRILAANRSTAC